MTSPDTSLVANSGPKPMIGLENLPQELKDQIYDYLFHECDSVNYYCRGERPAASELSRHAIFRTSKRVRKDAIGVFTSKVEVCWVLDKAYCWDESSWNLSSSANRLLNQLLPVDRLMNILLAFDVADYVFWYPLDSNVRCNILKNFGGAEILRKKIRIKFKNCSRTTQELISTRYVQGLATLTGFKTVVVEILMTNHPWLYFDDTAKLSDCKHLQTAIKDGVEPALGTAKVGSVELNDWGLFDGFTFLEFHPRQHSTKLIGNETAGAVGYPHLD